MRRRPAATGHPQPVIAAVPSAAVWTFEDCRMRNDGTLGPSAASRSFFEVVVEYLLTSLTMQARLGTRRHHIGSNARCASIQGALALILGDRVGLPVSQGGSVS